MQQEAFYAERMKRKTIRHNTAANQEKHRQDWMPLQPDEFGEVAERRIMPRDEQTRRIGLEAISSQTIHWKRMKELYVSYGSDHAG